MTLVAVDELVARNKARFPGESAEYRAARDALLAAEIGSRRAAEHAAELRRALPPGGAVPEDYRFTGEDGETSLSELFGDHDSLVIYSYMFGPERKAPCPMCTSFMATFEGKIPDVRQRVALAFVARSPIERLIEAKRARGWDQIPVLSDGDGRFTRAYVSAEDADVPGLTVFTRRDGTIRHFWSAEMDDGMADPGQDPRGQPEMDGLWLLLDATPEGRGGDWYPKLRY